MWSRVLLWESSESTLDEEEKCPEGHPKYRQYVPDKEWMRNAGEGAEKATDEGSRVAEEQTEMRGMAKV